MKVAWFWCFYFDGFENKDLECGLNLNQMSKLVLPIEFVGERRDAFTSAEAQDRGFHQNYRVGSGEGEGRKVEDAIGINLGGEVLFLRGTTLERVTKLFKLADVILTTNETLAGEEEVNAWRNIMGERFAMVTGGGKRIFQNGRTSVDRETYLAAIAANKFVIPPAYDTMKMDESWEKAAAPREPGEELMERALVYLGANPKKNNIAKTDINPPAEEGGPATADQILDYVIGILQRQPSLRMESV